MFTAGYGCARSFSEWFREPDWNHWATSANGLMTPGILYSIPLIAVGTALAYYVTHRKTEATA